MAAIQFLKTHPEAILPTKAYETDNCFDLYAVEDTTIPARGSAVVPVGLTVAFISPRFGFVIRPRSGLGFKYGLQPHLGEIDNGYRGDLSIKMYNMSDTDYTVEKGKAFAQFKIEKVYETMIEFADVIRPAERGNKGFGSSDSK